MKLTPGNEREEFEKIFDETAGMIYNLGLRLFNNNTEDALDFAQDVYLQAYQKLDQFEGRSRISTWLYSVALRLGLAKLKKEKRLRILDGDEGMIDSVPDPGEDVAERLPREEAERLVQEELADLPDVYRIPLLLYYYEKMSYREISEHLGTKEGTIKSYIHRGKGILRNKLKGTVDE